MSNLAWIFVSTLVVNNFTLVMFLGLCSFFGVTAKIETAPLNQAMAVLNRMRKGKIVGRVVLTIG